MATTATSAAAEPVAAPLELLPKLLPDLQRTAGWWLAVAFGMATFDVVRVHRPAFVRRPTALFGRFDPMGVRDLSSL